MCRKIIALFVVAFALMSLNGCATIIRGSTQPVNITSEPSNATVEIFNNKNNQKVISATTPTKVKLKRGAGFFSGAEYRVVVSKEGYKEQEVMITSGLGGGWYIAGNFFIGGLLGWVIVDPATGAMWKLYPKSFNANLQGDISFDDNEEVDGIYIVLKDQIPDDVFAGLDLVKIK